MMNGLKHFKRTQMFSSHFLNLNKAVFACVCVHARAQCQEAVCCAPLIYEPRTEANPRVRYGEKYHFCV